MCQLQDLQVAEIWSLKVRLLSNTTPRLRAVPTGLMIVVGFISRDGLLSLESWVEFPKMRNSVSEGLNYRRLADIQFETWEIENCKWSIEAEKTDGRNEMKSCVSSA